MKLSYRLLILTLVLGAVGSASTAYAQSEMVVEWADSNGDVIVNALRDVIANDTLRPDDRVYVLKRGGFYWNEDRIQVEGFHLRIHGQTAEEADPAEAFVCGTNFDEDCGPAIIQRKTRDDGSVDGLMIQTSGSGSHMTFDNVWFMGQTSDGVRTSWQPIRMNANDSQYSFDNVVFDRNNWQHLGNAGANTDLTVTNSLFRNIFGPAQQWEGMGMQFDAGADSVIIENNSFMNLGFTVIKNEAAPINYFRANHNTFINVGRTFSSGSLWKEGYITNNVFVNYFWHGEQPSEYEDPNAIGDFRGFFDVWSMPSQFGTNLDRRIVVANNSFWRDEAFAAGMPDDIRAQPVFSDSTMGWFAAFDGMVMQDNFTDVRAEVATYPDVVPDMIQNITELRGGSSTAQLYNYDPGRDEGCFECNIWPTPEDFSYETAMLVDAGTDGLALGDLNWFPDDKADFEANKADYVAAVEALAGARIELTIVASEEADMGTLTSASVQGVEGFTYYRMESSGSIEWTFEIPTAGTYDLAIGTRMAFGTKGQHLTIDGQRFKNQAFPGNGEFVWDGNVLGPDWVEYRITPDSIWVSDNANFVGPEVLDLEAGTHTLRITPSWGFQDFSGFSFIDPTTEDTVVTVTAPDAVAEGVVPNCDESEFCPTGFESVALEAGGSVAMNFDFPADGQYVARIFYGSEAGSSADLSLDGVAAVEGISFAAGVGDVLTAQFAGTAGVHSVTIASAAGGLNIDFVQLIQVSGGTGVGNEYTELPDGYALDQNYPNPFNPTTTISYTLAAPSNVRITVYDMLGRQVQMLSNSVQPAGTFDVTWDGRNAGGQLVSSGVYFYRMETEVGAQTRRMVFLK